MQAIATTTLMQATLSLTSIQYKYDASQSNPSKLTIKITTTSANGIYGTVKVQLANVKNYKVDAVENYFNTTLLNFTRTGTDTLESVIDWQTTNFATQKQDLNDSNVFQTLPNNGSAITAQVQNTSFTIDNNNPIKFAIDNDPAKVNPIGTNANSRVNINTLSFTDGVSTDIKTLQDYNDFMGEPDASPQKTIYSFYNKFTIFITEFTSATKIICTFFK